MGNNKFLEGLEKYEKKPSEFLDWLNKEPKEPEGEWDELKQKITPTCKYCGATVQVTRQGVFCSKEGRELGEEEVVRPDTSDEVEEKVNSIARKGARLFLKASEESEEVYRHLINTKKQGDEEWGELIKAIGSETPSIARQINDMGMPHFMTGWAVLSVKFLYENYDKLK